MNGTPLARHMTMITLRTTLAFLLFRAVVAQAQQTVELSSFSFSDGVHPTLSYRFEGTDTRYVESFWKDELKKVSASVSSKKEVIGHGALLPQVSSDTVRIYVVAEQRRASPFLTAYVAIQTTAGFIAPNSDPTALEAARAFVMQRTNALRRQLVQQELTTAENGLDNLHRELQNLEREKERAEASIGKSNERAAEAVADQASTRAEADDLAKQVSKLKGDLLTQPDPELEKELARATKDKDNAEKRNAKAIDTQQDMTKKAEELASTVKKNLAQQATTQDAIAKQEVLVKALKDKFAEIR